MIMHIFCVVSALCFAVGVQQFKYLDEEQAYLDLGISAMAALLMWWLTQWDDDEF